MHSDNSEKIKFSIIIPVYNSEKYLKRSLDSVINQTYKNLEIICINDGSLDNSLKILKEYVNRDNRFVIINQENKGQGVSRNKALDIASGDYISFLDSDDFIEPTLYCDVAKVVEKNNSNIVEFNYRIYYESDNLYLYDKYRKRILNKCKFDLTKADFYCWKDLKHILLEYKSPCCNKIYKREFLNKNNIRFSPHKNGEDIPFVITNLLLVDKIDLLHETYYTYCKRNNSSSNQNKKINMMFLFDQIELTREILIKANLADELNKDYNDYKCRLVYLAEKKTSNEYHDDIMKKAKEVLDQKQYLKFSLKRNINRILRNIFSIHKKYKGTTKTLITIMGFSFKI